MLSCIQGGSEIPEAVRAMLTEIRLSFGDPFEQVCVFPVLSARLCWVGLLVVVLVCL